MAASISTLLCRTISVCVSYSHLNEFFAHSATRDSGGLVRRAPPIALALFQLVPHSGPVSSRSIDSSSAASIFEGRSREVEREGREKTKKALVLYSVSCFVYPTSPAPLGVNSGKRDREPFEGESGRKRVLVE